MEIFKPHFLKLAPIFLAMVFSASACASIQRAELASRAQTELIGMSKKDLFYCAGAPVRSQQLDDVEFFTYIGGGDSVGYAGGVGSRQVSSGVFSSHKKYCEVTFVLKAGKVEKVNYAGRTGGMTSKDEQCAFVVEPCLQPK